METIVAIVYLTMFFLGLSSRKYLALFLPVFSFCFPVGAEYLNYGEIGLYIIFIILAFFIFYVSKRHVPEFKFVRAWRRSTVQYFVIIGLLSLLLSVLFAPQTMISAGKDGVLWILYLLVFLLYSDLCGSAEHREYVIGGFMFAAAFQSIVTIGLLRDFDTFHVFYDGKDMSEIGEYWRGSGTFKGPWDLGGYLALSIVMFLMAFDVTGKKVVRLLLYGVIGICLYALALTLSRASWLMLLAAVFYILYFYKKKIFSIAVPLLLLVIVFASAIDFDAIADQVSHRIVYSYQNQETGGIDNSTLARLDIWDKMIHNYSGAYFLTGYGIKYAFLVFGSTSHNTFLSLLMYGGLIAVWFVVLWVKKLIWISRRLPKRSRVFIQALLLSAMLYGLTADILYNLKVIVTMMIYVAFMISYGEQEALELRNVKNR